MMSLKVGSGGPQSGHVAEGRLWRTLKVGSGGPQSGHVAEGRLWSLEGGPNPDMSLKVGSRGGGQSGHVAEGMFDIKVEVYHCCHT